MSDRGFLGLVIEQIEPRWINENLPQADGWEIATRDVIVPGEPPSLGLNK